MHATLLLPWHELPQPLSHCLVHYGVLLFFSSSYHQEKHRYTLATAIYTPNLLPAIIHHKQVAFSAIKNLDFSADCFSLITITIHCSSRAQMDRESAMQGSSGGNPGAATQEEWLYPGGWQPEQAVVDGAFLMELLEDAPVADQPPEDVDRLSRVIRSLEAEIDGGGQPPSAVADAGTAEQVLGDVHIGALEDYRLLPYLGSIPSPCVAEAPLELWTEVPAAVGHGMGGWYLDGDGVMVGYEFREQCFYGYSESPHVEQVYSPLWE